MDEYENARLKLMILGWGEGVGFTQKKTPATFILERG